MSHRPLALTLSGVVTGRAGETGAPEPAIWPRLGSNTVHQSLCLQQGILSKQQKLSIISWKGNGALTLQRALFPMDRYGGTVLF